MPLVAVVVTAPSVASEINGDERAISTEANLSTTIGTNGNGPPERQPGWQIPAGESTRMDPLEEIPEQLLFGTEPGDEAQPAAEADQALAEGRQPIAPGAGPDQVAPVDGGVAPDNGVPNNGAPDNGALGTTTTTTSSGFTTRASVQNNEQAPGTSSTTSRTFSPLAPAQTVPAPPRSTTPQPTQRSTSTQPAVTTTSTTRLNTTTGPTTTVRPATTATAPPAPAAPTLVWQDNFDSLNSHIWRKEHSTYGDGNNELQCYRPENVAVANGKLILTAKSETYTCPNGSTRQATSGMVRSQGVSYEPGQRIEFRIKINPADPNDQRGLWPALWASSWNGGGWPRGGEFDWLEYVGTTPDRSNHAIHWQDTSGRHRHSSKAVNHGTNFSDGWHTISFDWGPELVWYVDGQEVQRINPTLLNAANNPFLPTANPVSQLKINFALGGNWPGPLGPTTIDAAGNTTFEVDYVRIYDLP